jgi:hypothetical protein
LIFYLLMFRITVLQIKKGNNRMATFIQSALSFGAQGIGHLNRFCENRHIPLAIAGSVVAAIGQIPSSKIDTIRKTLRAASTVTLALAAYGKIVNLQNARPPAPPAPPAPVLLPPDDFYNAYQPSKKTPLGSMALVPSQVMPNKEAIRNIPPCEHLSFATSAGQLNAIIIPTNQTNGPPRHCIFYNNPNAQTVGEFFTSHSHALIEGLPPEQFADLLKCPVVMYDYRGTGISKTKSDFSATAESLVEDGTMVLEELSKKFDHIYVIGTSLGGAVATAALHRHLTTSAQPPSKFHLINHDSFSTTHKVRVLGWETLTKYLAKINNALLDVREPMKAVIAAGVPVMVLSHSKDPVIPRLAQMHTFIQEEVPSRGSVTFIQSPEPHHAEISGYMQTRMNTDMPKFLAQPRV